MTTSKLFLSAVIPSLNRPGPVTDLVKDLLNQDYPNFEIIVVDQSHEKNQQLIDLSARDQRLKYVSTEIVGTCHARNLGVAAATGEIIVFIDDDSRLHQPDFLTIQAENYTDQKVGGVGGRVLDRNTALNRQQSGPVCTVTKTGRIFPNATSSVKQDINAPRGGNMSFRRQVILDVGGFDERFRGNAMREETDFSLRVVRAGWRIVYDPRTAIDHLALSGGSRSRDRITWYQDFFFNESLFFLKNFPRRYLGLLWLRKIRPMLACAIYYGQLKPRAIFAPWRSFREASCLVSKQPTAADFKQINPDRWIIPAAVLMMIGLGILIGWQGTAGSILAIAMWLVAIAVVKPEWVFIISLITIVLGQLIRLSVGSSASVIPNDLILPVLLIAWLFQGLTRGHLRFPRHNLWLPMLAVLATMALSLFVNRGLYSQSEFISGSLYFLRWVEYALLLFIGFDYFRTHHRAEKYLKVIIWTGIITALLGFIQLRLFSDFSSMVPRGWDPHIGRLLSTWFDPNFLGGFLAILITLSLGVTLSRSFFQARWWWIGILIMTLALLLTFSRSGYVALIAGVGFVATWRSRTILFLGALALVAIVLFVPRVQERVIGIRSVDETAQLRIVSWENALQVAADHPVTGVGYNLYRFVQVQYGFMEDSQEHSASGSDSSLLTILVTTGIIGLLAYAWLLTAQIREAWRTWRDKTIPRLWQGFGVGLVGAWAALLVHSVFINSLLYPHIMQVMWLFTAMAIMVRQPEKT